MTHDPVAMMVAMMLSIASHFLEQAQGFDDRVRAAIVADADQKSITSLMDLADASRMRALAACRDCAPYIAPRLAAIEVGPQSLLTQSKFAERIEALSDDEIADALRQIASGGSALALLEAGNGTEDRGETDEH